MREVKCFFVTVKGLDTQRVPFPTNVYSLNATAELIIMYIEQLGLEVLNIELGTYRQEDIELWLL